MTSTPEKTLSPKRRLTALKTCLFLKSWTLSPLWKSSAKPSTPWRVEKPLVRTAFPQNLSSAANLHYWSHFTNSCVCVGEKARCPRTCVIPRSLPCTKIRVIAATATTTEASPCSASFWQGVRQSGFSQTPGLRRAQLPRIPVRLQKQEILSGHDLLHSTAPGEVP